MKIELSYAIGMILSYIIGIYVGYLLGEDDIKKKYGEVSE